MAYARVLNLEYRSEKDQELYHKNGGRTILRGSLTLSAEPSSKLDQPPK